MRIQDLGGEFDLIEKITAGFPDFHHVARAVGDDAAVVRREDGGYDLFTTDTLVEGRHFNLDWHSPAQVALKTLEASVSDIAAMAGRPSFLLLNLVLPESTEVEFVEQIYSALRVRCEEYGVTLLGGDTTAGPVLVVNATVVGTTATPVYRSGAGVPDLICVTGDVGASQAGLLALQRGQTCPERPVRRHLEPRCRLDIAHLVGRFAHSMIDVSDGVGSEVRHICAQSGTGAVVRAGHLPIHEQTRSAALAAGVDPVVCALSGGEDYELLFTIGADDVAPLRGETADFTVIGEVLPQEAGVLLEQPDGTRTALPGGHDHFREGSQ